MTTLAVAVGGCFVGELDNLLNRVRVQVVRIVHLDSVDDHIVPESSTGPVARRAVPGQQLRVPAAEEEVEENSMIN